MRSVRLMKYLHKCSSTWTLVFETAWWPFLWLPHIGGAAAYEFAIFDQLFLETSWAHLWRRDARQGYQIWFFNWFSLQFWAFFERENAHSDHDFTVFYCRSLPLSREIASWLQESTTTRCHQAMEERKFQRCACVCFLSRFFLVFWEASKTRNQVFNQLIIIRISKKIE